MITPKENMLMALHRQEPYWVPSPYLDQNTCLYSATREGVSGYGHSVDCFGVSWDYKPGDEGPMVTKGTKRLDDIVDWRKTLSMPDCENWDWETCAARDTAFWDRKSKISSVIIINGLFEQLHALTGFEDALCYLLTEQEAVEDFLDALTAYRIRQIEFIAKYYKPDKIQFHDDYGSQRSTFMSLDVWRDIFKPRLKKIIDAVHGEGILYEHHSCGYIVPLIEEFIELGIDALNPLQVQNNPYELKKKYAKELCFVGGFDNQGILDRPGATCEERIKEIRYRIELMAPGGSWVAHPVMLDPAIGFALTDVLYEYNAPFWEKAGYTPPPKPKAVIKNAYSHGYEKNK
jgi:uroporphyrinogen decarboxylase